MNKYFYNPQGKYIGVYIARFKEFWIFSDNPNDKSIIDKAIDTLSIKHIYFNINE